MNHSENSTAWFEIKYPKTVRDIISDASREINDLVIRTVSESDWIILLGSFNRDSPCPDIYLSSREPWQTIRQTRQEIIRLLLTYLYHLNLDPETKTEIAWNLAANIVGALRSSTRPEVEVRLVLRRMFYRAYCEDRPN